MLMYFRVTVFPIVLMTALGACVGGAGGGSNSSVPDVPFTSFAAIPANQTVIMKGVSQTASGTSSTLKLNDIDRNNSSTALTYDATGKLSGLRLSTPQSSVSFGSHEIGCHSPGACRGANAESFAVAVDPAYFNWNYQSFGVWLKDVSTSSFQAGAMSAGAITPSSALPTGLTAARFAGHASGFYYDGAGRRFATDAKMNAITDFENRNIQFSTSGTLLTDMSTRARTTDTNLDLSGNWSYAAGTSQFSGGVKTTDGALTGTGSGRFYGPNAEEIGGVYGLSGSGGARMLGGFGGKR
jgi:hypothetical protein